MHKFRLLVFCILICNHEFATGQGGMWTCLRTYGPTVFGIQGVADSANNPPPVYEAAEWTDLQGNFWFFGGSYNWNEWADLWKYDPVSNMWTWVKGSGILNAIPIYGTVGVADTANRPGSLSWGAQTWTDLNGDLWLFGSWGRLWRYNIASNIWTWFNSTSTSPVYGTQGVPGPLNTPGCSRDESSATWVDDSGNLWLFGGKSYNDLWKYNITTDQWTWMKGSNSINQPDVYGIKGVEDSLNTPGARAAYCSWKDFDGNFWLFGGGKLSFPTINNYNDLWKYNTSTNNWTWMGGSNLMNQGHVSGPPCVSSSIFIPAAREESRSRWVDNYGNFWLLGGGYTESTGYVRKYGDLWNFNPTTLQWAYINGGLITNTPQVIDTIGLPSPNNQPGGHYGAVAFKSLSGELYLFGGGFSSNALWKFTIDTTCVGSGQSVLANFSTLTTLFCDSACIDFTDSSTNSPTSWLWSFPGAIPDTSILQNPTNICYTTPGVYTVSLIASNAVSSNYIRKTSYLTITNCSPTLGNFMASQLNACDSTCVSFTDSSSNNPTNWLWSFPGGIPDTSSVQNPSGICYTMPGSYTVTLVVSNIYGIDTIVKNNYINIHVPPSASVSYTDSILCLNDSITLLANTNTGINFQWYHNSDTLPGVNSNSYDAYLAGYYYFMTIDSFGCQAFSDTVALSLDSLPININLTIPVSNCTSAQLCAPFDSSFSYIWNTSEASPCINIDTSGTYLVTITNTNGCISLGDTTFNFPSLSALLIQSNDSLIAFPIDSSYQYSWLYNGISYPMCGSNPYCLITTNGNYQVIIIDSNGCVDTSFVITITDVGIHHNSGIQNFKIIPNPTNGKLVLEVSAPSPIEVIVHLVSYYGQEIYTDTWKLNEPVNRKFLDLSKFSNGKYFCVIIANGRTISKTFEIIHD